MLLMMKKSTRMLNVDVIPYATSENRANIPENGEFGEPKIIMKIKINPKKIAAMNPICGDF